MKRFTTKAIVLSRTNFGEADRILTFLTLTHGKVRGLARGVRKQKSKLAGGIELFSISEITFLVGRGEILTIVSTRLDRHFGNIVKDLERTSTAYELMRQVNKQTEDNTEEAYFNLLATALEALDEDVPTQLVRLWFNAQLLRLNGHSPNLRTDKSGQLLSEQQRYQFDSDRMGFVPIEARGRGFAANDIKFLRLLFSNNPPEALGKIEGLDTLLNKCAPLIQNLSA